MVSLNVNGEMVSVADSHPNLLAALREELNLTSAKDGCSPSGQCGCCAVLIDGKAQVSCQTSLAKVEGKSIVTLEGLPADERGTLAAAFSATGALQCGFCTPGILIRTKALLDKKGSDLDRDTAARFMGGHLCRCTGYTKILDAVENLAKSIEPVPVPLGGIGSRGAKYEATELALGDRGYVDDLRPDGLLHAALSLTQHARADILAIDTSAAEQAPGVVAVYTAADVPGQLKIGIIYEDWPVFIPVGGRTS
ncbi:MAG: 2Fe-2S iron-sulfur cluster-binding protein, partial [Acidimicrobiales bacterium]